MRWESEYGHRWERPSLSDDNIGEAINRLAVAHDRYAAASERHAAAIEKIAGQLEPLMLLAANISAYFKWRARVERQEAEPEA